MGSCAILRAQAVATKELFMTFLGDRAGPPRRRSLTLNRARVAS